VINLAFTDSLLNSALNYKKRKKKRTAKSTPSLKKVHHDLMAAYFSIALKATCNKLKEWPSTVLTSTKPTTTEELPYTWLPQRAK
jgi:hypothetical protein